MKCTRLIFLLFITLFLISFVSFDSGNTQVVMLPEIDVSGIPNGIVPLPASTPSIFTDLFTRYTNIIAPNSKPIHFLAQDAWTDDKIIKAKNVMEYFLQIFLILTLAVVKQRSQMQCQTENRQ